MTVALVIPLSLPRPADALPACSQVSPRQTFEDFVPHFRRLIAAPAWGPPLPEGEKVRQYDRNLNVGGF